MDNAKGKIIGVGKNISTSINNVYLVDGLKYNLLSISQLCDKGYNVLFEHSKCIIHERNNNQILFTTQWCDNIYSVTLDDLNDQNVKCFTSIENEKWLSHRRLGHASMYQISKLIKKDLVRGIPKIEFDKDIVCDACQKGKQTRISFQARMLSPHQDLWNSYILTYLVRPRHKAWVEKSMGWLLLMIFLGMVGFYSWFRKMNLLACLKIFARKLKMKKVQLLYPLEVIMETSMKIIILSFFCAENGISHNFSSPRTPQQNGVMEKRNRSL